MQNVVDPVLLALIIYAAYPGVSWWGNVELIFCRGWSHTTSMGFEVLPLCFAAYIDAYWIVANNAIAGGMMTTASYSLFVKGAAFHATYGNSCLTAPFRTGVGTLLGLFFILGTKSLPDRHTDLKLSALGAADTRNILLIVFFMSLHSFSEGMGFGFSFGGEHGRGLHSFISVSLKVHNVLEGLTVVITLLPHKMSKATAAI